MARDLIKNRQSGRQTEISSADATFRLPLTSKKRKRETLIKQRNNIKKQSIMKNLATLITCASLAIATCGCAQNHTYSSGFGRNKVKASNNYVTKEIKVEDFTGLRVTGSPDVSYTQRSGKPRVEVYTSDNIVELLDIYVKDNTLYAGFKKNINVSYNKLEIRVFSEKLNEISVSGSGDVVLKNGLKTDGLQISIAGSGDIQGNDIACTELGISIAGSGDVKHSNIQCTGLQVSIAGSGDLKLDNVTCQNAEASVAGSGTVVLSGSTQEATYKISGSGDLFASDFQAKRVSASVSGSGDIKCHASDFLKVRTSGSGSVGYKGDPELDYPKKGLYKL